MNHFGSSCQTSTCKPYGEQDNHISTRINVYNKTQYFIT